MNRLKSFLILLILFVFNAKLLVAKSLNYYIHNNAELVAVLIILFFILVAGLIIALVYFNNIRRENIVKLYLNIENMWNSTAMLDSRKNAANFITDDILHSNKKDDEESLRHSRVIIDFFNHLGMQVYNGLIEFSYIYNLLGQEIIDYWDNKNYKLLVAYDKHKSYPTDISPWVGFEYLADLCIEEKEYLRGRLWVPAYYPPITYQPLKEHKVSFQNKSANENKTINTILVVISIISIITLFIFGISYIAYSGYF